MPEEKMRKVCVSSSPLVVDFPDGGPQNGIFCSLMSHVLSPENCHPYPWKLSLSSNVPSCLYHDCIQFQVPKYPGSVTLFDRYEFFEVHVHTSEKKKLELWQHTRNALFDGMETVCETLGHAKNKPRPAIICPATHRDTTPHPAYIDNDENWNCILNPNKFGEFRDLKIEYPWHSKLFTYFLSVHDWNLGDILDTKRMCEGMCMEEHAYILHNNWVFTEVSSIDFKTFRHSIFLPSLPQYHACLCLLQAAQSQWCLLQLPTHRKSQLNPHQVKMITS